MPALLDAPVVVAAPRPRTVRTLRIGYLTTEYPKVSHTFVRREIAELERRGHHVVRLSVRPAAAVADPADRREAERTFTLLGRPKWKLLAAAAGAAAFSPARFLAAARTALRLNARSDRGLIRHAAYLCEAALLARRLRAEGVRHVHVHFGTNAAAVALLLKKLAGISYSMTVHGPGEFDAPVGLSVGEKVAESAFTAAISNYGRAQLGRWVAPPHAGRIHVVRCTVQPGLLEPPPRPDRLTDQLVCVGRLTAQKGQLLLVDAFAELVKDGHPGRLVFAGDGELRAAVEARVKEHGLAGRVLLTGWLSEAQVRDWVLAARAVVLPSAAEGLPVVLMEALALGRPVVSTFVAGIPELVKPGENGWLVPAGDAAALTAALRAVVAAPDATLLRMGEAGRAAVLRQHHPVTEGDTLERLLLAATSGTGPGERGA